MADDCWIKTHTGKRFRFKDPRPEDIDLRDIAHSLGHLCRYAGHTPSHYSVAQHSCLVYHWLEAEGVTDRGILRWGLLHDAAEAYCVDVPSPLKRLLRGYNVIEEAVLGVVRIRFDLPEKIDPIVKMADQGVGIAEVRDLMGNPPDWPLPKVKAWQQQIIPGDPVGSKWYFLACAEELGIK